MAALVCINSKRFYSTTIKLSVETKTYFLYERQNWSVLHHVCKKLAIALEDFLNLISYWIKLLY